MPSLRRRARLLAAIVSRADLAARLATVDAERMWAYRRLDDAMETLGHIQHLMPASESEVALHAKVADQHHTCAECCAVELATAFFARMQRATPAREVRVR